MSLLVSISKLTKTVGSKKLFAELSFGINERERTGLLGPNGAGKSTLLKILSGIVDFDEGEVTPRRGLKMAFVEQEETFAEELSVLENAVNKLKAHGLDAGDAEIQAAIQLSMVGFENTEQKVAKISGGWRKRLSLAIAFAQEPELLLLDEPTNHMDWDGILWLESHLKSYKNALVLVSHDRQFLNGQCNKMMEINRLYEKGFLAFSGNYQNFLDKKQEYIDTQLSLQASMSNKARREVEWLRAGVKARTTKSQSRIKEAHELLDNLESVKQRNQAASAKVKMEIEHGGKRSKKLLEFKKVDIAYGDNVLIKDLELLLGPKTRLGLLGDNGSGKTTLLKIMANLADNYSGSIFRAENAQTVYFDQKREDLPKDENLLQFLGEGSDYVNFRNSSVHVASYASRFLFPNDKMRVPIAQLSGGEQARLLIAKLLLNPADILILDEPTNDLDIDTIEILEEALNTFPGLAIVVSHDRYFLSQVCHKYLALDGQGGWTHYADIDQWLKQRSESGSVVDQPVDKKAKSKEKPKGKVKLTYKEKRQMETIEADIEKAENELAEAQAAVADPAVFADHEKMQECLKILADKQKRVDELYQIWQTIEAKMT